MSAFTVHPAITAETAIVGDLPLSRVLLTDETRYPWLMLLPRTHIDEIVDLSDADQIQLIREVAAASAAVRSLFKPDKINVGALGNKVRQMHFHVLGRWTGDPAWPGPVWGHSPAIKHAPGALEASAARFREALAGSGLKEVRG